MQQRVCCPDFVLRQRHRAMLPLLPAATVRRLHRRGGCGHAAALALRHSAFVVPRHVCCSAALRRCTHHSVPRSHVAHRGASAARHRKHTRRRKGVSSPQQRRRVTCQAERLPHAKATSPPHTPAATPAATRRRAAAAGGLASLRSPRAMSFLRVLCASLAVLLRVRRSQRIPGGTTAQQQPGKAAAAPVRAGGHGDAAQCVQKLRGALCCDSMALATRASVCTCGCVVSWARAACQGVPRQRAWQRSVRGSGRECDELAQATSARSTHAPPPAAHTAHGRATAACALLNPRGRACATRAVCSQSRPAACVSTRTRARCWRSASARAVRAAHLVCEPSAASRLLQAGPDAARRASHTTRQP
jgi:hypothetical protein